MRSGQRIRSTRSWHSDRLAVPCHQQDSRPVDQHRRAAAAAQWVPRVRLGLAAVAAGPSTAAAEPVAVAAVGSAAETAAFAPVLVRSSSSSAATAAGRSWPLPAVVVVVVGSLVR